MAIVYPEPLRAYKFLIEYESTPGGATVAGAFAAFSGIRMRVDVLRGRSGTEPRGTMANRPGLTHFENVTLTNGIVGDNDFMDWILACAPSDTAAPTGKDMRRNITVVGLTDQNQRGVEWTLINCLPVGYVVSPMDAGKSALITETVEFAIEGFKRKVNTLDS